MHKTLYIDTDEEITNIIDRVRREGAPDIFLVVPKNAMLTQGIINLRLLKKESERMNKNVLLVTNDKYAKKVIERAGLEITDKIVEEGDQLEIDKHQKRDNHLVDDDLLTRNAAMEAISELKKINKEQDGGANIGSPGFYDANYYEKIVAAPTTKISLVAPKKGLDIGAGRKHKGPTIHGRSLQGHHPQKKNPPASSIHTIKGNVIKPKHIHPKMISNGILTERQLHKEAKQNAHRNKNNKDFYKIVDSRKAEEFFSPTESLDEKIEYQESQKNENHKKEGLSKGPWIVISVIIILALASAAGFWTYQSWPRAKISIYPKTKNVFADISVIAAENAIGTIDGKDSILGESTELKISKTMQFSPTGENYSAASGRAVGKVTIYNKFSSSPQPLVATTRILSKEGKLFRLSESVTIPGMKNGEPGVVQASVAADKPGDEYNIGATTFTIEGFKDTPSKYEKFEVISDSSMTSSGRGISAGSKTITTKDLDQARLETLDALEKSLEQEVVSQVGSGKKVFTDSMEKEIVENSSSNKVGDSVETFSYTISEKVKTIAFSEEEVRKIAKSTLLAQKESGYELMSLSSVEYKTTSLNFAKKQLEIKARVNGVFVPKIDTENIKVGIAGKTETEMKEFLENYSEISKVEVEFSPAWLSTAPATDKKIEIEIKE